MIKLFESFVSDYKRDKKSIIDKYKSTISLYLHEIGDKYTLRFKAHELQSISFSFEFNIKVEDLEKLDEVFHQGIFDRILNDHPNENIQFDVIFSNKSGDWTNGNWVRAFHKNRELSKNVEEVFDTINKSIKSDVYRSREYITIIIVFK